MEADGILIVVISLIAVYLIAFQNGWKSHENAERKKRAKRFSGKSSNSQKRG